MKIIVVLVLAVFCLSFRPSIEKIEPDTNTNMDEGFYILVQDFTNRSFYKYIVESKDSVDIIFNKFFNSELQLGEVDRPMTINNGKRDFYIARVKIYEKSDGSKDFKNLKYPPVYVNEKRQNKRLKRNPVYL